MKKALAYVATAVLLGFVVMMVPLAIKTGPPTYQPEPAPPFVSPFAGDAYKNVPDTSGSRFYGQAPQPSNLISSGIILFSGLAVALSAYAILRKQTA